MCRKLAITTKAHNSLLNPNCLLKFKLNVFYTLCQIARKFISFSLKNKDFINNVNHKKTN